MRYPPRNGNTRIRNGKKYMKTEKYVDTISNEILQKEITYWSNGESIFSEYYSFNSKCHRRDGPAKIWYDGNGKIKFEEYWINSVLHREDGPAAIDYYENGKIKLEIYCLNDLRHNIDGPAFIKYNEDGGIIKEAYWINGIQCDILQQMVIQGLEKEKIYEKNNL